MQVQQTKTITVDGAVYQVEKMSDQVKTMIAFMDDWRQKETDLIGEVTLVRAALRDIQNSIYTQIQEERKAAEQAAAQLAAAAQPAANDASDVAPAGE